MVVEALCGELQVEGHGDVGVLHVLRHLLWAALLVQFVELAVDQPLGSEVECWRHPEVEMRSQPEVGQHTHGEARVPRVLVHGHGLHFLSLDQHLRADVAQFDVLCMQAHEYAKVQRPQVDVRLVLHPCLLRGERGCATAAEQQGDEDMTGVSHGSNYINNAVFPLLFPPPAKKRAKVRIISNWYKLRKKSHNN